MKSHHGKETDANGELSSEPNDDNGVKTSASRPSTLMNDEAIIEKITSYWKTMKNQELINDGIVGQEKEQRLIPSRATKYAFNKAIKLARADEREKILNELTDRFEEGFSSKLNRFILYPTEWVDIKKAVEAQGELI